MKQSFLALLLTFATMMGCNWTTVEPGYVGILVRNTGPQRGVDPTPHYGRVHYDLIGESVVKFPITLVNEVWTASRLEASEHDESITFACQGGVPINVDVGLTFHVDANKAAALYTRYHQNDIEAIADGEIRNRTRDCLAARATTMPVNELLSGGRNVLLNDALGCLREKLGSHGIVVEGLTFVAAPRIPPNVQTAINSSLEAQQTLVRTQAEAARRQVEAEAAATVALTQAQAAARVAMARAESDAQTLLARGRADSTFREMDSTSRAAANQRIAASLTPALLRQQQLTRWDGHTPRIITSGSSGTMLSFTDAQ